MNQIFDPILKPNIEPIIEPNIEPVYLTQYWTPIFKPIFNPIFNPIFYPNFEPNFEPNIEPNVEPKIEPSWILNWTLNIFYIPKFTYTGCMCRCSQFYFDKILFDRNISCITKKILDQIFFDLFWAKHFLDPTFLNKNNNNKNHIYNWNGFWHNWN